MKDIRVIKNYSDVNTGEVHLEGEEFKVPIARAQELLDQGVVVESIVKVDDEKVEITDKKEKVEIVVVKEKKEIDK